MSSFLEKLKKGTKASGKTKTENVDNQLSEDENEDEDEDQNEEENDEAIIDEEREEKPVAKSLAQTKKNLIKKTKKLDKKLGNLEVKSIPTIDDQPAENDQPENSEWLETEGQLGIDMYQTENDLVVQAAIAGIKTEDLDVLIEDDVLTIKGKRNNPYRIDSADYFIQECYWGAFSRRIILPVEVDASKTDAQMRDGILTIRIPKLQKESKKRIVIKG
ncbi:MAG TPA: Hsp20/alpha crystallin family protein [Candidatus Paceibacterota bacterium]|nr:Hsp20/alpha crystallin family protein [Candidatus Pacearchaeota archaeon]HRZ51042.1 Hsp20/alpha crystallin family protein [Candidatus Paceibacterota bacterium]HSA36799.1 Hsp20/alpha crystallin family protein [Candidatus Paceibacterota bacterium]